MLWITLKNNNNCFGIPVVYICHIKNNIGILHDKVNIKDILRVCKFFKTQPRPVAKNATPRPSVRIINSHKTIRLLVVSDWKES